jgi:hypothetical protein
MPAISPHSMKLTQLGEVCDFAGNKILSNTTICEKRSYKPRLT